MSSHNRVEIQHLIHADALEEWHISEVSGSIHQVSPRPASLIEQEDAALRAPRLLKEPPRGS